MILVSPPCFSWSSAYAFIQSPDEVNVGDPRHVGYPTGNLITTTLRHTYRNYTRRLRVGRLTQVAVVVRMLCVYCTTWGQGRCVPY
jgi:hypothetical protein